MMKVCKKATLLEDPLSVYVAITVAHTSVYSLANTVSFKLFLFPICKHLMTGIPSIYFNQGNLSIYVYLSISGLYYTNIINQVDIPEERQRPTPRQVGSASIEQS